MFAYWGGFNGAKKYVKRLMGLNSKCYVEMYPYAMVNFKHKCHWFGRNSKWDLMYDISIDKQFVHRHKDHPDLFVATKSMRHCDFLQGGLHGGKAGKIWPVMKDNRLQIEWDLRLSDSFICPDEITRLIRFGSHDTIGFGRLKDPLRNKRDHRFFSDIKYKDTRMYYDVLNKNKVVDKTGNFLPVTPDDIPETHVVFPYIVRANYQYDTIDIDGDKFKNYVNVLPYKVDHIDGAINAMENYGENLHGADVYNCKKNTVRKMYKENKQKLWEYLDWMVFEIYYVLERKLVDAGIKIEWFNLDKDSFANFFGVEKSLPRLMRGENIAYTILTSAKDKKACRKNYRLLEKISREWLSQSKYKDKKDTRYY